MKSIVTSVPVIRGSHGSRLFVFSGILKAADLLDFIGHDYRSKNWKALPKNLQETYSEVQRRTAPGRVSELTNYIRDRIVGQQGLPGALPAISIAVDEPIVFNATAGLPTVGSVSFTLSALRMIADGIARATAILNMSDTGTAGLPDLAIVIYAPKEGKLSRNALSQQFADFNGKGILLSAAAAGARDRSNPIGNTGKEMLQLAVFRRTLGKDYGLQEDKAFRFVRAVFEKMTTDKGRKTPVLSPVLENKHETEAFDVMRIFWNRFAADLGENFYSPSTAIFRSALFNAIAFTLNHLTGGNPLAADRERIEEIAAALAQIDWDSSNEAFLQKATYVRGNGGVGFLSGGTFMKDTFDMILAQVQDIMSRA